MRKLLSILVLALFTSVSYAQLPTPMQSVPFELFGDHIFIKVKVDDSEPLDFIFDTGDGLTVIDADVAEKLDLEKDHDVKRTSASGSVTGSLILHNKIEIGEMEVKDVEVYALSLNHLEQLIGRNVDGIIGFDLLDQHIVQVDYSRMEFEIYDPKTFKYSGDGIEFDLDLTNYIPHIPCEVKLNNGEVLKGEYFVNTGAGTTMDFNTPFVNKHDIIDKTGEHYSYLTGGLGREETLHYEGRVSEFKMKGFTFKEMPVGISQAEHGIQHSKKVFGIIGNNVLRRFNIIFDYSNYKMYWEKNETYDEAFHVNTTGFDVQLSPDLSRVLVHRTYEIGVAKELGIQVGDEIVEVDGKPVGEMKLPDIKKLINNEGGNFKMKIVRGGKELEVDVERHDLI